MGLIPEEIIDQVIGRTDIVALVGSYVPLKKAGRNYKGACPFHNEKTPSFIVNPDKQIFHCFGCATGGNAVKFLMLHEHLEFPEAVRLLAEKAGIPVPDTRSNPAKDSLRQRVFDANEVAVAYFQANLITGSGDEVKAARDYLRSRGINADCAKRFRLGFAYDRWDGLIHELRARGFDEDVIRQSGLVVPREDNQGFYDRFRGRVIFSIFDYRGRAVAFGARAMRKEDKAKYINSPETSVYVKGQHLYGFDLSKQAVGDADAAVIVEGYLDFIRPFSGGVENVAASCGTALTVDQIRLIRRYTRNVIMLYDMDTAGQMAALRSLDILLDEDMDVRIATLAEGEDPDSFILKYGIEDFKQRLAQAKSLFDFKLERLMRQFPSDRIEGRAQICREMLPTIGRVKSEVVKSGYMQQLAQRMKVPETALFKEARNLAGSAAGIGGANSRERSVSSAAGSGQGTDAARSVQRVPGDEAMILKLVLRDPHLAGQAYGQLTVQDFTHPAVRMIMEAVFAAITEQRPVSAATIWQAIEDDTARKMIGESAADPGGPATTDQKMFDDCLARLRKTKSKIQRDGLRVAIRGAECSGDRAAVLELQKQFNQLIKE